jgi:hypothetical protein
VKRVVSLETHSPTLLSNLFSKFHGWHHNFVYVDLWAQVPTLEGEEFLSVSIRHGNSQWFTNHTPVWTFIGIYCNLSRHGSWREYRDDQTSKHPLISSHHLCVSRHSRTQLVSLISSTTSFWDTTTNLLRTLTWRLKTFTPLRQCRWTTLESAKVEWVVVVDIEGGLHRRGRDNRAPSRDCTPQNTSWRGVVSGVTTSSPRIWDMLLQGAPRAPRKHPLLCRDHSAGGGYL